MDFTYLFTLFLYSNCCLLRFSEAVPASSAFYSTPPAHITIVESQTLRLKCTPKNMNNDINWSKVLPDGEEQPLRQYPDDRFLFEIFDHLLIVTNIEPEDSGQYKCAVINKANILDSFVIDVQVHSVPYWTHLPEDLLLEPGGSGEIDCDASGSPLPTISWEVDDDALRFDEHGRGTTDGASDAGSIASKDGRRGLFRKGPRLGGKRVTINTTSDVASKFYLNGTKLVVRDAQYENAVKIRCIASNDYGKIMTDIYLDVFEMAPRFLHTRHAVSQVVNGNDITIQCTAVASPTPVISWTLDSNPITMDTASTSEPRLKLNDDGSLTIYRVMQSYDEDMYMCKAKNALGEVSASGKLRVRARTRVECPVKETKAKKGKHLFLRCTVHVDPALQATVTWEKNGKPINPGCSDEDRIFQLAELGENDSVLVIRSIIRSDSGVYSCVARTDLDNSAAQTTLTVQDVPDRPGPVEVTYLTDTAAVVSWEAGNSNDSPTELFIVYMNSTWNLGAWKILKMLPPGSRNTIVDLEPWTSYNFRVTQLNGVGYSEHSEMSLTYRTAPTRPYSNPENVRAESNNSSFIDVYWEPVPPRQFHGRRFHYVISWRQPDIDDTWKTAIVRNPLANHARIPTSAQYSEYEIRVRAANEVGMAPTPWSIDVYPMSEQPSGAPNKFSATVISSTEIELRWQPIDANKTGGTVQGYTVRYWRHGSSDVEEITTPSTTTMLTISDLVPASEYVMHIWGFNHGGDGPTTSNVDVVTPEDVPGPVTDFVVHPEGNSLLVRWNAPRTTNGILRGYQIIKTRYTGLNVEEETIYIPDPDVTNFEFTNVAPDTTYKIEVQTSTEAGFGTLVYWEGRTP